eukprot:CAMPEP_0115097556 /NCGR_PEP_ID=MMETSP0227-20121206/30563_1 /TAXON_ID=89957 /ORGANISM="Polarella glacialis, Strain CCMP 1383" /LENGTH=110 /DNA_ID=CAMNT_0002491851 /DNA_START=327 /DNA_END=656 /DNA_ORIENTATION=+
MHKFCLDNQGCSCYQSMSLQVLYHKRVVHSGLTLTQMKHFQKTLFGQVSYGQLRKQCSQALVVVVPVQPPDIVALAKALGPYLVHTMHMGTGQSTGGRQTTQVLENEVLE